MGEKKYLLPFKTTPWLISSKFCSLGNSGQDLYRKKDDITNSIVLFFFRFASLIYFFIYITSLPYSS